MNDAIIQYNKIMKFLIIVTARCGVLGIRQCLSVCLSLTAFPHYITDLDVTWEMVWVPSSYALLG